MTERFYRAAIRLYPPEFHARNGQELLLAFRDLRADMAGHRFRFWIRVLKDLAISLTKENFRMFNDRGIRRVIVLQSALMTVVVTLVALMGYVIAQQALRQGANYPQVQMAQDATFRLAAGGDFHMAGDDLVDPSRSLAPFLIVFDASGHPISSSAALNGKTPVPPPGVFSYARDHREDRVSWQPRPGVRIAAVIMPFGGQHPGFVLAGRSLSEVEASEQKIWYLTIVGWITLLFALGIGTAGVLWSARESKQQLAITGCSFRAGNKP
jgi:hypothetical protein